MKKYIIGLLLAAACSKTKVNVPPAATCATANPCSAHAACTDSASGPACACNSGYSGDGKTCADVNECAAASSPCDAHAACTNSEGSYACACNAGFTGDGHTCADVDECAVNNGGCDANAACTNTPGSFSCACKAGYEGNGQSCARITLTLRMDVTAGTIFGQVTPAHAGLVVSLTGHNLHYDEVTEHWLFDPTHPPTAVTGADGGYSFDFSGYAGSIETFAPHWLIASVATAPDALLDCGGDWSVADPAAAFAGTGCLSKQVDFSPYPVTFDEDTGSTVDCHTVETVDAAGQITDATVCACPEHGATASGRCVCDEGYHPSVNACVLTVINDVAVNSCADLSSALAAAGTDRYTTVDLQTDLDLSTCSLDAPALGTLAGTIEGNYHHLTGFTGAKPFIGTMKHDSRVQHLTFDAVELSGGMGDVGTSRMGALAGELHRATVFQVRITGSVEGTSGASNFFGYDATGGFAGAAFDSTFEQCAFEGTVHGTYGEAAGFAGVFGTDTGEAPRRIVDSYALATITGRGGSGGLVGLVGTGSSSDVELTNTFFRGSVTSSNAYAAGLAGYFDGSASHSYAGATVSGPNGDWSGLLFGSNNAGTVYLADEADAAEGTLVPAGGGDTSQLKLNDLAGIYTDVISAWDDSVWKKDAATPADPSLRWTVHDFSVGAAVPSFTHYAYPGGGSTVLEDVYHGTPDALSAGLYDHIVIDYTAPAGKRFVLHANGSSDVILYTRAGWNFSGARPTTIYDPSFVLLGQSGGSCTYAPSGDTNVGLLDGGGFLAEVELHCADGTAFTGLRIIAPTGRGAVGGNAGEFVMTAESESTPDAQITDAPMVTVEDQP